MLVVGRPTPRDSPQPYPHRPRPYPAPVASGWAGPGNPVTDGNPST